MGQIKNIKLHIVTDIKYFTMVNVPTSVQVFGRKKTATAVAFCKRGQGLIKVNGRPLDLVEPVTLRMKVQEPVMIIGKERFAGIDIRVSVKGVVKLHRCMLSVKPFPKLLLLITRSLLMKHQRKKLKIFSCSTIDLCLWLIQGVVKRRSSVVQVP